MDNQSRKATKEYLRQIAQMCRTHGAESDWSTFLGDAARPLDVRPACPPLPNLRDPAACLGFFGQTFEFAVFPRRSKRHLASGSDIFPTRRSGWCWIYYQITADALRPESTHDPLCD